MDIEADQTLDVRGMKCPLPVLRAAKSLRSLDSGQILEVWATDGQAPRDFRLFCEEAGHELLKNDEINDHYRIVVRKA